MTSFTYDTAGNLTLVEHPDATTEEWTYDTGLNLPLTYTDRLGNLTVYEYDTAGNLTLLRNVFGYIDDEVNLETDDVVTEMTYTPAPTLGTDPPAGLLESVTDGLGRVTEYVYNAHGLATSITFAVGTTLEATAEFVYDSLTDLLLESSDELGRTTTYEYDDAGRLILTTLPDPDGTGPLAAPEYAIEYNLDNRVAVEIDPLGRETSYIYGPRGVVTSITRPDHDGDTELTVTELDYDDAGRLTGVTDPLGRVTTTVLNSVGWVLETILPDPDGTGSLTSPTIEHDYDALGRLIEQTDPLANVTVYEYANFGREITITLPDPDGSGALTSPELFFEYDAAGNLILEIDELGNETTYEYDELNRLITVTAPDPDGTGSLTSPVTTYEYDKLGNLRFVTDPLANITEYVYDERNRLVTEILPDPDGTGSLTSPETTYTYDDAGQLLSLTDPVANLTAWEYDSLGRVIEETNELTEVRTFEYDAAGNLIERTDRLGRVIQFEYDALNHLVEETWYSGTTLVRTLSFAFDAAGQLLSASDPAAGYEYEYDGLGRLTSETQSLSGLSFDIEYQSTYDAASSRTELLAILDGLADFENTYAFDDLSRLTSLQQQGTSGGNAVGEKRIDFAYTAASQFDKITRYADIAGFEFVANSFYSYDGIGRLTKLLHTEDTTAPSSGWGTDPLAGYAYSYDAASRILSIDSYLDGLTEYDHDDTNQFTGADHTGQTDEVYSYDENGNRTMSGHTVGDNNQLLSDGTYDYEYDAEGNRSAKETISTGEREEYAWDHRNRLTTITFKNSSGTVVKTVEQTYDAFNRWIERSIDPDGETGSAAAVDTIFSYEDGLIVLDFDGDGNLTHRYVWGPRVDLLLAAETVETVLGFGEGGSSSMSTSFEEFAWPEGWEFGEGEGGSSQSSSSSTPNLLWPLLDHLNTVRDVAAYDDVANDTTIVNHRRYDSYGVLISETDTGIDILFGFTARPFDESTGLQNNLNRWYALGVWLSEDPIGFIAGDENLRRYVGNSPSNRSDPSGLWAADSVNATFWRLIAQGKLSEAMLLLKDAPGVIIARKGTTPGVGLLKLIYDKYPAAAQQCTAAATKTQEVLRALGQDARITRIFDGRGARIWTCADGTRFSSNGYHDVVISGGRVYDALTGPAGMTIAEYIKMMNSIGITPVTPITGR